jgi:hypothetical protein
VTRFPALALVLSVAAACAVTAGCAAAAHPDPLPVVRIRPTAAAPGRPAAQVRPPVVAKPADVLGAAPVFGVSVPRRGPAALEAIRAETGCRPQWEQFFASVADTVSVETLGAGGGVPMMSLEPWHPGNKHTQPDFTLKATIDGKWDQQYLKIASAVVRHHDVVMIRFAHEMNGHWYPWGTGGTNTPAQYVAAWRHVVSLFRKAGATNALWIWSPNILRGTHRSSIRPWWPGDSWVDLVGLTGYGVKEASPEITFKSTLRLVYALTDKRIILTETGAEADPRKRGWITGFGPWLHANPRISGFIWTEMTPELGGTNQDWRFDDDNADLRAFKGALAEGHVRCAP